MTYDVQFAANVLSVHPETIRRWVRKDLMQCCERAETAEIRFTKGHLLEKARQLEAAHKRRRHQLRRDLELNEVKIASNKRALDQILKLSEGQHALFRN